MSCFRLFLQPTKKHESSNPPDAGTQHKTPGKTSHSPDKQEDSKDEDSGKDGGGKEDGGDDGEQEEEEEKKPEIEASPPICMAAPPQLHLSGLQQVLAASLQHFSCSGILPRCCIN